MIYPLIAYTLAQINEAEKKLSDKNVMAKAMNPESNSQKTLAMKSVFLIPRFTMGLIS